MKLFYYKDIIGNFGDDLNPWLWDKLLPNFFDDDENEWLVGIGTLLNHKLPAKGRKFILGSGYGYGTPPNIDSSYHFFSVRGPKTAEVLGIDRSYAITDPAILIQCVYQKVEAEQNAKVGFIPHYDSVVNYSWDTICNQLDIKLINVQWPVDKFLAEISTCKMVICEAMHGAIVADSLRIPWVPTRSCDSIDSFKWEDWLTTLGLPYEPLDIQPLYDAEKKMASAERIKNKLKRSLKFSGLWISDWDPPWPRSSNRRETDLALNDLHLAMRAPAFLSEENICLNLVEKYQAVLEQVRNIK